MNKILKDEHAFELFGTPALARNVVADDATGRIYGQTISASRTIGAEKVTVELRFDDKCKNGHESFAITGRIYEIRKGRTVKEPAACGCIHEEIVRVFPELASLIKWHLVSTDGPMHYLANTLYLAGNLDHNGLTARQVSGSSHAVRFGDSPVTHKIQKTFWDFLRTRQGTGEFLPVAIAHGPDKSGYKFDPKWTFPGYGEKWHLCPFDSLIEAQEWAEAMRGKVEFLEVPTSWSKGKERELDAARRAARWPDATNEQLCLPRDELKALLVARLPGLLTEFKKAMLSCGFIWPKGITS